MKKILALILALLMALSLCACGSYKSSGSASYNASYAAGDSSIAYDYEVPMAAAEPADYAYEESYGFSTAAAKRDDAGGTNGSDVPQVDPEKIIYSSDVTVETTAFEDTIAQVEALVKEYGGWIESSSVNGANYYDTSRGYTRNRSASYSLRIPSDRFRELMGSLSNLGNIPYSHTYTENVTAQYYDVQARLTAYEAQEARLLEMMELAETVEDVIALESRLSELRYQIESLQSTLNNWDRRVSYSSIYLEIQEVQVYTPEPEHRISYGEELLGALQDGLEAVANFFKEGLVILVACLPLLIVLAILIFVIVWIIRKVLARRKARKAAKRAAMIAAAAEPAPTGEEKKE